MSSDTTTPTRKPIESSVVLSRSMLKACCLSAVVFCRVNNSRSMILHALISSSVLCVKYLHRNSLACSLLLPNEVTMCSYSSKRDCSFLASIAACNMWYLLVKDHM